MFNSSYINYNTNTKTKIVPIPEECQYNGYDLPNVIKMVDYTNSEDMNAYLSYLNPSTSMLVEDSDDEDFVITPPVLTRAKRMSCNFCGKSSYDSGHVTLVTLPNRSVLKLNMCSTCLDPIKSAHEKELYRHTMCIKMAVNKELINKNNVLPPDLETLTISRNLSINEPSWLPPSLIWDGDDGGKTNDE